MSESTLTDDEVLIIDEDFNDLWRYGAITDKDHGQVEELIQSHRILQQQCKQLISLIDHIETCTSDGYVRNEIRGFKALQGGASNDS